MIVLNIFYVMHGDMNINYFILVVRNQKYPTLHCVIDF